jgi:hypothetical protein
MTLNAVSTEKLHWIGIFKLFENRNVLKNSLLKNEQNGFFSEL